MNLIQICLDCKIKFSKWIAKWLDDYVLQSEIGRRWSPFNEQEYQAKLNSVHDFFHSTMPALNINYAGIPIIEEGSYNWLILPSSKPFKISFFVPILALFVIVSDISSASWDEAGSRGITRLEWETTQTDLDYIATEFPKIPTLGSNEKPRLRIIKWADSVNHHKLKALLLEPIDHV